MTNELPDGELEILWDDGEFVLSRVSHSADRAPTLAVCPAALHPNAASLVRLAHAPIFLILLALLRHKREIGPLSLPFREATAQLEQDVAMSLMTVERVRSGGPAPTGTLGEALRPTAHLAFSYTGAEDNDDGATRGLVALYRELGPPAEAA